MASPEASVTVWVSFTDRAGAERDPFALALARQRLAPRALARRERRAGLTGLLAGDLPVHEPYVRALVARGARLRGTSRWLNAASVEVPARLAMDLIRLPFVARIERVPVASLPPDPEPGVSSPEVGGAFEQEPHDGITGVQFDPGDQAFYGQTWKQLEMMQVPALHALGLTGASVLVCMLDTGYRLTQEALIPLQIAATRDFVHGDFNVDYDPDQDSTSQVNHGTQTVACLAGNKPGTYMGAAYGAAVALGKTHDVYDGTPVQMDHYQFGAEWADSLGADIISSSLGYYIFNDPADNFTYADMDGRTTVATIAAVEATRRGITVVTGAGNTANEPWYYVVAPGDADSVITCGAVDSLNVVASFSAHGPTADGRIKPDVTAMGRRVRVPVAQFSNVYQFLSGTSFATPLTAGLAALLLESHPSWGPFEVREALRETALNHATPNNDIGWGLVQGVAANNWMPSTIGVPMDGGPSSGLRLAVGPNPMRPGTPATVHLAAPGTGSVVVDIVDVSGRRRALLYDGDAGPPRAVEWRGLDDGGSALAAGVYWVRAAIKGSAPSGPVTAVKIVVLP